MPAWQVERVAVVVSAEPAAAGARYARRYPFARVEVLLHSRQAPDRGAPLPARVRIHHTRTLDQIRLRLQAMPPLDLLVDAARITTVKSSILRHLIFQVADGGTYVVEGLDRQLEPAGADDSELDVRGALDRIARVQADPSVIEAEEWSRDELARAAAVGSVEDHGSTITIHKTGAHAVRVHDPDADLILRGRNGSGWGRVLETRDPVDPPIEHPPHANRLLDTFRTSMPVPRMYLREYLDVVCAPRQLAVQGDVILPISYHHGLGARLNTRSPLVTPVDAHYALLDRSLDEAEPLPGTYFHFDSEFPGHFGHLMTEDIAKLWGWETVQRTWPDARILLSTLSEGARPLTVHHAVLEAWGIDVDRVTCIDRPVRIQRLVGATQMFYNGIYVHPELLDIWARLREALRTPAAQRTPQPPRIFVTRPPNTIRACRNAAEVESLFAEHGFAIVRPELLSIPEQVDLFAQAEFVAGFGGSGMFSALYAERPGRRIVISSDHYKARNEWAIAAAKGDDYHHFFGEPEVAPGTAEGWRVFHSPFTFDFARDGDALRRLIS